MFANSSCHLHFPSLSLRWLPREFSDHCPLILSNFLQDHGWRPFCFLDSWTQYPNFKHIIENFWNDACSLYPGRFKVLKKLNHIAVKLRQWNKLEFGNQEAALQRTFLAINILEEKCEEEGLTDQEQEHLDFLLKDLRFATITLNLFGGRNQDRYGANWVTKITSFFTWLLISGRLNHLSLKSTIMATLLILSRVLSRLLWIISLICMTPSLKKSCS